MKSNLTCKEKIFITNAQEEKGVIFLFFIPPLCGLVVISICFPLNPRLDALVG
jgi:hypothetical protein